MSCICYPGERLKCLSVDRSIGPMDVACFDDEQLDDKELAAKRLYMRQQALIKMHHDIEVNERIRINELKILHVAAEALKRHSNSESGIVIKDPSPSITYSQGTTEQRMEMDKRNFLENQKEIARQKEEEINKEYLDRFIIDWPEKKYTDSFWESLASVIVVTVEAIKYEIKNYITSIKERYDL